MRSTRFPKRSLAAAALGGILLTGLGAAHATAAPAPVTGTTVVTDPAETRFLELADLIAQSCSLAFPTGSAGVAATATATVVPVPLTAEEQCAAQRHQSRISRAFSGTGTPSYEALRDKLTTLRYPAARIHRMPDFSGEPVVRIDLRVGADHLAVQVTDIGNGVMVEAFGAPDGVSVTEVRVERQVDWPTS
ncbi:hypothetical protein G6045_35310 [Streptomyces sp. YC504]|uniref:Uncharacterized protein n=1 Tax=Streptomyces mesophilus TaxID=1775132 RepID=A0A6G4XTG3_9ACTN|nr:hypothetical protein [Streptomyces mesophilus]NGO80889.1 hypothetical protein [Streptomyces mesophilus]